MNVWRTVRRAAQAAGTLLAVLLLLSLVGTGYQSLMSVRDLKVHPPPGQLVRVGDHRLHLWCRGTGEPTIVLEAGLFGTSLDWHRVVPELARTNRTCAYDRAGYGWSEPGPGPRDGRRMAAELDALLNEAGLRGPFVLVGHSHGSYVVRLFAANRPERVAGIVLVDPSYEHLQERLPRKAQQAIRRQERWFSVLPLMGRLGIARLMNFPLGMTARYEEDVRPAARAVGLRTSAFLAAAAEGKAARETALQAAASRLPEVPLTVISSNPQRLEPPFVPEGIDPKQYALLREQGHIELARLSPYSLRRLASASGHYVHLDEPEVVIRAVREVATAASRE